MRAVSVNPVDYKDGRRVVEAFIISDDVPTTLPVNGATVEGLSQNDVFAPFSILYVVNMTAATKVFIADESGTFIAQ